MWYSSVNDLLLGAIEERYNCKVNSSVIEFLDYVSRLSLAAELGKSIAASF